MRISIQNAIEKREKFGEILSLYLKYRNEIDAALTRFVTKNKIYVPISNLAKFEGQAIYCIKLVASNGDTYTCGDVDILTVENGHLYSSDEYEGIIKYDEKSNKYYRYLYGHQYKMNVVGFRELELSDPKNGGTVEVEETTMDFLLKKYLDDKITVNIKSRATKSIYR